MYYGKMLVEFGIHFLGKDLNNWFSGQFSGITRLVQHSVCCCGYESE